MTKSVRTVLAATSLAALLATLPARAVEPPSTVAPSAATLAPELAQLRGQIAQLRQTLELLDQRLQQMQRAGPTGVAPPLAVVPPATSPAAQPSLGSTAAAAAPAAPALDPHEQAVLQQQVRTADALSAWQELHNGMRLEEVRRLLGEPQSIITVGNRTGWIYTYRNAGKGSVFFGADGTVVSLMSPGQGTLHLY